MAKKIPEETGGDSEVRRDFCCFLSLVEQFDLFDSVVYSLDQKIKWRGSPGWPSQLSV